MFSDRQFFVLAAVATVAGVYGVYKARAVVSGAADAVNPFNNDNVFSGLVNDGGALLSGDEDFTLGGWFWDFTHDDILEQME